MRLPELCPQRAPDPCRMNFSPSFSSRRGLSVLCPCAQSQSCRLLPGSCENRQLRGIVHSWNLSVLLSVITHPGSFSFPSLGELSSLNPQVLQGLESCQPPAAQDLKETPTHFHNLGEQTNTFLREQVEQTQNRRGKSSVSFPLAASFTFIPIRKKKSLETNMKIQGENFRIFCDIREKLRRDSDLCSRLDPWKPKHSSAGNSAASWSKRRGFASLAPGICSEIVWRK